MTILNQNTMRTPETQEEYMHYLEHEYDGHCFYCARELLVKEYMHWIIVENRFPYDKFFDKSHQLAPKRHVASMHELSFEEMYEFINVIERNEAPNYNHFRINSPKEKSMPDHLHWHLLGELL